jgi:hypothetical protein
VICCIDLVEGRCARRLDDILLYGLPRGVVVYAAGNNLIVRNVVLGRVSTGGHLVSLK